MLFDEFKRLQAVRLYGSGLPIPDILQFVLASESRLCQWVQLYRSSDFEALRSKWQGDNANKLTDAQRADLKTRLHTASLSAERAGVLDNERCSDSYPVMV